MVDRLLIEELGEEHLANHLLYQLCANLLVGQILAVLRRDENRMHAQWRDIPARWYSVVTCVLPSERTYEQMPSFSTSVRRSPNLLANELVSGMRSGDSFVA